MKTTLNVFLITTVIFSFGISFSQTNKEFLISNSEPIPQIDVLGIESVYSFNFDNKSVRVVIGGAGGATDFGAYKSAYLVFDNGYEMPWRHAIYDLGSFGNVETVSKKSESEIVMEVRLYSKLESSTCEYCKLKITVNLSDVLKKENLLNENMREGSIASKVRVLAEELGE
jgi:hypothetical protein